MIFSAAELSLIQSLAEAQLRTLIETTARQVHQDRAAATADMTALFEPAPSADPIVAALESYLSLATLYNRMWAERSGDHGKPICYAPAPDYFRAAVEREAGRLAARALYRDNADDLSAAQIKAAEDYTIAVAAEQP